MARLIFILLSCFAFLPVARAEELKLKHFGIKIGRLAFTYFREDKDDGDIYVIDFQTLKISPLFASAASDENPCWSPDGKYLIFHSDVSGDREIYAVDAHGENLNRLSATPGADEEPDFSPDGEQIVFHSSRGKKGSKNIYLINANGGKAKAITSSKSENLSPAWSPRGDSIVYSTKDYWPGTDLILYDLNKKEPRLLTNGWQSFFSPAWRGDGAALAFSYGTTPNIDIWLQEIGGKPTELTRLPGRELDPTWRDDDEFIFFVTESGLNKGDFQLAMIEVKTKTVTRITEGSGALRHPTWTPLPTPPTLPKQNEDENELE